MHDEYKKHVELIGWVGNGNLTYYITQKFNPLNIEGMDWTHELTEWKSLELTLIASKLYETAIVLQKLKLLENGVLNIYVQHLF